MYLNRDMDGGPFLVYFLPILGGQKAAMSDLVEGWLPVCSRQPWSFQGVHGVTLGLDPSVESSKI
jgi:hypothetical protein